MTGITYVAHFDSPNILGYPEHNKTNNPPKCAIRGATSVNWIASDQAGNIFVPEGGARVTNEYAPRCGPVLATFASPNGQPVAAVVDGKHLYVSAVLGPNNSPGSVQVYSNNAISPTRTLSDSSMLEAFGLAVDRNHNLFLSYMNQNSQNFIIEFPRETMPGKILPITTEGPSSVLVDDLGNLLVVDVFSSALNVYAPPYTGAPMKTINLIGLSVQCAFGEYRKHIYCTDYTNTSIDAYMYPSGLFVYNYTRALDPRLSLAGIAVAPAPSF